MSEPVYLWCGQKDCKNHILCFNKKYKPIDHDAIKAGWKYEDGKYCCKDCDDKNKEKSDERKD